jgi:hypothetical protein
MCHVPSSMYDHFLSAMDVFFLALGPCEHLKGLSCYGDCLNLDGNFYCQCPKGTYGDPFTKDGCTMIKRSYASDRSIDSTVNIPYIFLYLYNCILTYNFISILVLPYEPSLYLLKDY